MRILALFLDVLIWLFSTMLALLWLAMAALGGRMVYDAVCTLGPESNPAIRLGLGALGLLLMGIALRNLWQSMRQRRDDGLPRTHHRLKPVKDGELTHPAVCQMERPFRQLCQQFRETAPHDELVLVEETGDFISWNNQEDGIIQIQSVDGDEWISIFWSNGSGGHVLTDKQLATLAQAENVELPPHFLGVSAEGFAHYRKGRITLYPAALKSGFSESFLRTIMATPKAFRKWLDELIEDEKAAEEELPLSSESRPL